MWEIFTLFQSKRNYSQIPEFDDLKKNKALKYLTVSLGHISLSDGLPWENCSAQQLCIFLVRTKNHLTLNVEPVCHCLHVFMGSIRSFYQCKNHNSSQIVHTGPLRSWMLISVLHWRLVSLYIPQCRVAAGGLDWTGSQTRVEPH